MLDRRWLYVEGDTTRSIVLCNNFAKLSVRRRSTGYMRKGDRFVVILSNIMNVMSCR